MLAVFIAYALENMDILLRRLFFSRKVECICFNQLSKAKAPKSSAEICLRFEVLLSPFPVNRAVAVLVSLAISYIAVQAQCIGK